MEMETEDYGPTYRYFSSKLQRMQEYQQLLREQLQLQEEQRRLQERQQRHLEWLRGRTKIIAGYMADSNERSKYPSYEAALADFLEMIEPDDAFRDEAVQIFQQVWEQSAP